MMNFDHVLSTFETGTCQNPGKMKRLFLEESTTNPCVSLIWEVLFLRTSYDPCTISWRRKGTWKYKKKNNFCSPKISQKSPSRWQWHTGKPPPPASPWLAVVTRRIFWVPQTRRPYLSEDQGVILNSLGVGTTNRLDVIVCENSSQKKKSSQFDQSCHVWKIPSFGRFGEVSPNSCWKVIGSPNKIKKTPQVIVTYK